MLYNLKIDKENLVLGTTQPHQITDVIQSTRFSLYISKAKNQLMHSFSISVFMKARQGHISLKYKKVTGIFFYSSLV